MILLDTHVWWWSLAEPENLSKKALATIKKAKTDERFIASISIWEFAMMAAKRRIDLTVSPLKWISKAIEPTGITVVELSPEIATESCNLPAEFHKDPADRMIVATARIKNLTLITKDRKILDYPHVKTVW